MVKMELHGHTKTHIVEAGQRTIIVISIKFLAYSSKFSQNFREIAGNPINLNFRDKSFVIATFFCDLPPARAASRAYTISPPTIARCSTFRYYTAAGCETARKRDRRNKMTQFESQSCVIGFHVYRSVWTLSCSRETSNLHDPFAVKVLKTDEIVICQEGSILCARARFQKVSVQIQSHL